MMQIVSLLFNDIWRNITQISLPEVGSFLTLALWLVIVAMPLPGVDRRDEISMLVYALFLAASGVLLLFIIPENMGNAGTPFPTQILAMALLAVVGAIRWVFVGDTNQASEVKIVRVEKSHDVQEL